MTENKRAKISPENLEEAARLKQLWNSSNHMTQADFGEQYGLGGQANVGHYLNGRSALNHKAALAFATELGCEVKAFSPRLAAEIAVYMPGLTQGIPPTTDEEHERQQEILARLPRKSIYNPDNVAEGPNIRGLVPLISEIQAGAWCDAEDPFQPGDAEDWLPCPARHGPNTYALRVKGDSMTAPTGNTRTYPEGCIVFVDPAKNSPVNGDRVVAKLASTEKVTFKVYKEEDGRRWLAPLNPMHPPIHDEFTVCGTVIGKWEDG